MAKISGKWKLKDTLTSPAVGQLVNFTSHLSDSDRGWDFDIICSALISSGESDVYYRVTSTSDDAPEDAFASYPIEIPVYSESGWSTSSYGSGIKTVTFTGEQEVSDEFCAWFTANASETDGGDDDDDGTDTPVDPTPPEEPDYPDRPTADTIIAKIKSLIARANEVTGKADRDLTDGINSLAEGYGVGGEPVLQEKTVTENGTVTADEGYDGLSKVTVAVPGGSEDVTVIPLTVTENGVYDTYYAVATETWDNNTEYEGSVTVDGVTLSFKRAENLIVPDDLEELNNNAYTFRMESDISDDPSDGKLNENLSITPGVFATFQEYAVIWVKLAAPLNQQFGISFLEDNTVYITNYAQMIMGAYYGAEYVKVSVTAPSEKIENAAYRPVTVDVKAKPRLTGTHITENGDYSPPDGYDGFSNVTVDMLVPSGSMTLYENREYNVREIEKVKVAVPNAAICGVWRFNDNINTDLLVSSGYDFFGLKFGCNGQSYTVIGLYDDTKGLFYQSKDNSRISVWTPSEGWASEEYKTIDLGQDPQVKDAFFKEWITSNATMIGSTTVPAEPILQEKTVTENGEVTADYGYDGLSKVIVNIPYYDGSVVIE